MSVGVLQWQPAWPETDCDADGCPNDAACLVTIVDDKKHAAGAGGKEMEGALCFCCYTLFLEDLKKKKAA